MTPAGWGWLILVFPLWGCVLVSVCWRSLPARTAGWLASAAVFGSFVSALGAFITLQGRAPEARHVASNAFAYAHTAGLNIDLGILVDPLSVFMALVVSGVSFLIHVYSVAYMTSDRGHSRYFAYLNFFVFSMLLLIMAGNFVLLIVGWAF
ncbi:MAG: NADH-quinone oxidoreductase subunit, partial [Thermoleophilaceae bacterium]|nr:NADH-quinone oxidoreductase subunit [Thermoleophilaceae bacterium]